MLDSSSLRSRVNLERLTKLAEELVAVPSPTLANHQVADLFAAKLEAAGMAVEVRTPLPVSKVVIGRLKGVGGGRTIEFNGHLDHVPVPHAPPHVMDGRLYGRGSLDMKANLASVVESVLTMRETGIRLQGDLLISAHGIHEAPGEYEHGQDREILLQQGIHGDACVVVEGPNDFLPVEYGGLTVFDIVIERPGAVTHGLATDPGTSNPLYAGAELTNSIEARGLELAEAPFDYLGPDSYHLGILEGGDYFNRFPTHCHLVGTRRNNPNADYDACLAELEGLVARVVARTGLTARVSLKNTRDPGAIPVDHELVSSVQAAHERVVGERMSLGGLRLATDAPLFMKYGVPSLCHGPRGGGAHGDVEWVDLKSLAECAVLWAETAVAFCGVKL